MLTQLDTGATISGCNGCAITGAFGGGSCCLLIALTQLPASLHVSLLVLTCAPSEAAFALRQIVFGAPFTPRCLLGTACLALLAQSFFAHFQHTFRVTCVVLLARLHTHLLAAASGATFASLCALAKAFPELATRFCASLHWVTFALPSAFACPTCFDTHLIVVFTVAAIAAAALATAATMFLRVAMSMTLPGGLGTTVEESFALAFLLTGFGNGHSTMRGATYFQRTAMAIGATATRRQTRVQVFGATIHSASFAAAV